MVPPFAVRVAPWYGACFTSPFSASFFSMSVTLLALVLSRSLMALVLALPPSVTRVWIALR